MRVPVVFCLIKYEFIYIIGVTQATTAFYLCLLLFLLLILSCSSFHPANPDSDGGCFFFGESMQVLRAYIRFVDGLNERVGRVVSWLTAVLVAVVCYDVFTRYLLKNSLVAVQELEWHLFGLIFLLGAAYSLKHDQHVRVDVFYSRFSARKKAWVNLIGSVLFLIPFCIIVIVSSQYFVVSAFHIGETSPDPGGLPARWVLKAAIPLGFVLLLLQGLGLACRSLLSIRDEEVDG